MDPLFLKALDPFDHLVATSGFSLECVGYLVTKKDQDEDWMSTVITTVFDSLESATWREMTCLEIRPGRYNKRMYEIIQSLIPGLQNLEAGRGNKREKPSNSKNKYYLFPCGSFNWCLVFLSSEPHNLKSLGVGHVNLFLKIIRIQIIHAWTTSFSRDQVHINTSLIFIILFVRILITSYFKMKFW